MFKWSQKFSKHSIFIDSVIGKYQINSVLKQIIKILMDNWWQNFWHPYSRHITYNLTLHMSEFIPFSTNLRFKDFQFGKFFFVRPSQGIGLGEKLSHLGAISQLLLQVHLPLWQDRRTHLLSLSSFSLKFSRNCFFFSFLIEKESVFWSGCTHRTFLRPHLNSDSVYCFWVYSERLLSGEGFYFVYCFQCFSLSVCMAFFQGSQVSFQFPKPTTRCERVCKGVRVCVPCDGLEYHWGCFPGTGLRCTTYT